MDCLKKYVLREIRGIYILVNIKENELIEVDKDTFILINMIKSGMKDAAYIGNKIGKKTDEVEEMMSEIRRIL